MGPGYDMGMEMDSEATIQVIQEGLTSKQQMSEVSKKPGKLVP